MIVPLRRVQQAVSNSEHQGMLTLPQNWGRSSSGSRFLNIARHPYRRWFSGTVSLAFERRPTLSGNAGWVASSPVVQRAQRRHLSLADLEYDRRGRERVVILGSGWAGFNFAQALDHAKYQAVIVSPRSYFVFTPLLASTSVGTLEFRNAIEPIRSRRSKTQYIQGWAVDVDFLKKTIVVEEAVRDPAQGLALTGSRFEGKSEQEVYAEMVQKSRKQQLFDLQYDKLIIGVGAYSQTFNTPGVREHANFLKDVGDARRIRKRVLECFEMAALPTTPNEVRRKILNFAVVGGGPTGIEFASELHDLIHDDLAKIYPELEQFPSVTVHDVAEKVLGMFDEKLSRYAMENFHREGINIKTSSVVEELKPGLPDVEHDWQGLRSPGLTLHIKGEKPTGVGMVVWSTGLMPNPFIKHALNVIRTFPPKEVIFKASIADAQKAAWTIRTDEKTGSVLTNDRLRVMIEAKRPGSDEPMKAYMRDVFAIGDCAILEGTSYPATAQVANQKAEWLAKRISKNDLHTTRFTYKDLGIMSYVGNWRAIVQGGQGVGNISGRTAWLIWRGAYLVKTISWRNRILVVSYWLLNWMFGRDISRF